MQDPKKAPGRAKGMDRPPHPSRLVPPTPAPTTHYAVTIGRKPGVYQDVTKLDLQDVASLPRFSMSSFTRWEDAVEYYRKAFDTGNVHSTGSGNNEGSPINVNTDAPTPPAQKNKASTAGLIRRNDSFSRMGTPPPQPVFSRSKALDALGFNYPGKNVKPANNPKPSGAATRVKKAPRGPDGKRLVVLKDVIDVSTDEDDSDMEGLIVPRKIRPAPSALPIATPSSTVPDSLFQSERPVVRAGAPFPLLVAGTIPSISPSFLAPAPGPFANSVAAANLAGSLLPAPTPALLPLTASSNPNPVTPVPKRRYIKIYFENESDFDDPAVMCRILESACKTPASATSAANSGSHQATPGPSNQQVLKFNYATASPTRTVTRASSVPAEALHPASVSPLPPILSPVPAPDASPSSLSVASHDTEAELGYGPMDPNILKDLEY